MTTIGIETSKKLTERRWIPCPPLLHLQEAVDMLKTVLRLVWQLLAEGKLTVDFRGSDVQVRGYSRRDGTSVRPHSRRTPRRNKR